MKCLLHLKSWLILLLMCLSGVSAKASISIQFSFYEFPTEDMSDEASNKFFEQYVVNNIFNDATIYCSTDKRLLDDDSEIACDFNKYPATLKNIMVGKGSVQNGRATVSLGYTWKMDEEGRMVYYRVFSPHYSRVIKDSVYVRKRILQSLVLLNYQQTCTRINVTATDVDGKPLAFYFVPKRIMSNAHIYNRFMNGLKVAQGDTGVVYIPKGERLDYLIVPQDYRYAVHTGTYVENGNAQQSLAFDYSKAKKVRLYITNEQGKRCSFSSVTQVSSAIYADGVAATNKKSQYAWGYYCGMPFATSNFKVGTYAKDGANYVEFLALPGDFVVEMKNIQSDDATFILPCNFANNYVVRSIHVGEDAVQNIEFARCQPDQYDLNIKGLAKNKTPYLAVRFYSHYPVDFAYNQWWPNYNLRLQSDTIGDDVQMKITKDASSGNLKPYFYINMYVTGYRLNEFVPEVFQQNNPILSANKITATPVVMDAPVAIRFTNCYSVLKDDSYLSSDGNDHLTILSDDESKKENIRYTTNRAWKTDTITVYLPKGTYKWKLEKANVTYTFNAYEPLLINLADHSMRIDAVTTPAIATATAEEKARYAIDGRKLSSPQRGVNIVVMSDGTTRKIIVK